MNCRQRRFFSRESLFNSKSTSTGDSGWRQLSRLFLPLLAAFLYSSPAFPEISATKNISNFSQDQLNGWQEKDFRGKTSYQVIELDGERVLQAISRNSASGLYKKIRIDLHKYPYLNWRWRIENRIETDDERTRAGDDYAARIYLVVDGGLLFWKTRALSYVWAKQAEKGTVWNNAYAGKSARMMALKSALDSTAAWYTEKRNVYEDLKQVFGEDIPAIDAVALMTDTDDSGSSALSYYAEIYFSAE